MSILSYAETVMAMFYLAILVALYGIYSELRKLSAKVDKKN